MKLIKSELLALKKILEMTVHAPKINGQTRKSRIIHNEKFIQKGLSRRDNVIKATNSLVKKGLVWKFPTDPHYFVYTPIIHAVHVFDKELLEGQS